MDNGLLPDAALAPIAQGQLAKPAAAAWNSMNLQARRMGLELVPTGAMSSYRNLAQQKLLYGRYLAGGNLAAKPGSSNHGWGLAVDGQATFQVCVQLVDRIRRNPTAGRNDGRSRRPALEWWHLAYRAGGSGPALTPGPTAQPNSTYRIGGHDGDRSSNHAQDGRLEVFIEKASDGSVCGHALAGLPGRRLGLAPNPGKRTAAWQSLGTPGK